VTATGTDPRALLQIATNVAREAAELAHRMRQTAIGVVLLRGDYSYRSSYDTRPNAGLPEFTKQDGFGLLNARLALTLPGEELELALFGKNLTDQEYIVESIAFGPPVGLLVSTPGVPRTWGLTATLHFD